MWKTTVHATGIELDGRLRSSVEEQVRRGLGGIGARVGHVHVRLYGDLDGTGVHTCYVRLDWLPSGGLALGDTAATLDGAVARAVSRIAAAATQLVEDGRGAEVSAGSRARRSPIFSR